MCHYKAFKLLMFVRNEGNFLVPFYLFCGKNYDSAIYNFYSFCRRVLTQASLFGRSFCALLHPKKIMKLFS